MTLTFILDEYKKQLEISGFSFRNDLQPGLDRQFVAEKLADTFYVNPEAIQPQILDFYAWSAGIPLAAGQTENLSDGYFIRDFQEMLDHCREDDFFGFLNQKYIPLFMMDGGEFLTCELIGDDPGVYWTIVGNNKIDKDRAYRDLTHLFQLNILMIIDDIIWADEGGMMEMDYNEVLRVVFTENPYCKT